MGLSERVAARFTNRVAFRESIKAFGVGDLKHLSQMGRSFGVISAYRSNKSKAENQERHGQLVADLQKLGFHRIIPLKSHWEDMDTKVVKHEKSVLIPNIAFHALIDLGKKYEQDAVLFKDPSGSIGIYFKDGTATMAFDPEGDAAITVHKDPTKDYSRGRGLSFGLQLVDDVKFHYSGHPVTRDDVLDALMQAAA